MPVFSLFLMPMTRLFYRWSKTLINLKCQSNQQSQIYLNTLMETIYKLTATKLKNLLLDVVMGKKSKLIYR